MTGGSPPPQAIETNASQGGASAAPKALLPKSFQEALLVGDQTIAASLNDDFNTPEMFAAIFNVVRIFNSQNRLGQKLTPEIRATAQAFREWIVGKGSLMSLFQESPQEYLRLLDDMLLKEKDLERKQIDTMVEARSQARLNKDFKKSDELRDELTKLGISIQDTVQGTAWEVTK